MSPILKTAAGNRENQDRGAILRIAAGFVLVVTDGAGGISGATEAAMMAIQLAQGGVEKLRDSATCAALLQAMDRSIADDSKAGETTCALAVVTGDQIFGASVGDSGIWIIGPNKVTNLTETRKPFIGSGGAFPAPFEQRRIAGDTLLLATDGLLKYTSAERIAAICRENDPEQAAGRLIEAVRYPSGTLPDDVTVILAKL